MNRLYQFMLLALIFTTTSTALAADQPLGSAVSPDYALVETSLDELESLMAAAHLAKAKRALQRIRDGKSPELSKQDLDTHLLKYQQLIGRKGM